MGTQRNFGVTVTDTRWQRFIERALQLGSIEMRVGILRGGTKYKAGWVGTRSRKADSLNRFAALKSGERVRSMLSAYRDKKKKAPGFGRKARRKRVDVAKVAAVVGFEAGKRPKIPGMWFRTNERMGQLIHGKARVAMELALKGQPGRRAIEQLGQRLVMAYKADVLRSGHVDTGLLLRTVKWEIVDVGAQLASKQLAKAKRTARRLLRAG